MKKLIYCLGVVILAMGCSQVKHQDLYSKVIDAADNQYKKVLALNSDVTKVPRTLYDDGKLKTVNIYNWTSGFFAGNLWYMYDLTKKEEWKNEAIRWTEALDTIQYWSGNHDVGFMIYCSYGNALRLTQDKKYEQVVINTAESLSKRYSDTVKCIKSWNYRKAWDGKTEWFYPVIIDNMMNLELLYEASKLSGNNKYRDIATQHAMTTMKNHYRDDYSCVHVVDYDKTTGEVLDKATCQGFTDESSWARGQSWGLYGYTLCYRETKNPEFLKFAENIANYIMTYPTIPEDKIPFWDYNVDQDGFTPEWKYDASKYAEPLRDVSAATIAASALLELSTYVEDGAKYYNYANDVLKNVASDEYMASKDENFYFLLKHSVGSIPHGGDVDKPVNYADYYYLEALCRKKMIDEGKKLF
ncbi:glucuronyl hydrolase [Puteibacter caeruleilacunae]|nr:glucuronyl hydrolase [Puteibacter caeruleilacunae]